MHTVPPDPHLTPPRRATRSATATLGSTCALFVGLVLGLAGPAAAHNVLISTDPVQGATLPEPPPQITLTFDDDVLAVGTVVQVTGPDGVLDLTAPEVTGSVVTQRLSEQLPGGQYSTLWRVTSADGHAIDGTLTFAVVPTPVSPSTSPTPGAPSDTPTAARGGNAEDDADVIDDDGISPLVWAVGGIAIVVIVAAAWIGARRNRSR